jgi:hypothetical protein
MNPSISNPQDDKQAKEEDKSIEIRYRFPKIAEHVIARMKVVVGGRTVEAKVMEKEKAQGKYDNAVAAGNTAALMVEEKGGDYFELQIGRIDPG